MRGLDPRMATNTPPCMPTIYYIRHGETEWNIEGRLQGAQDVPLNDVGRAQSITAGRTLPDLLSCSATAAS